MKNKKALFIILILLTINLFGVSYHQRQYLSLLRISGYMAMAIQPDLLGIMVMQIFTLSDI